jgi:hypothetical protein
MNFISLLFIILLLYFKGVIPMCRNRITGSETREKIVSGNPPEVGRDYPEPHLTSEKSVPENNRLVWKIPGNRPAGIM